MKPAERIDYKSGELDDLWLTGVDVHVEDMGDGNWYVGIYRDGLSIQAGCSGFYPYENYQLPEVTP